MSGRELDPDGTDGYHPQHPFEQSAHKLYLPPSQRTKSNWPPVEATPAGPHEARYWRTLPPHVTEPVTFDSMGSPIFRHQLPPEEPSDER